MNRWIRGLTTSSIVVCASWLTTSLAAAQPSPPPAPSPASPPLAAEPAPAPLQPPPVARPAVEPADSSRPTELAFGIGVGYSFPTSLQTPNTTSVRLRLPSGLTLEPQLVLATSSSNADPGNGGMTDRKSTRLNSSHSSISYAVFCLKKKKKKNNFVAHTQTQSESRQANSQHTRH